MTLVESLTTLHRRLTSLPSRFDVPSYRDNVVLVYPDGQQELVEPNPSVKQVDRRFVEKWLSDNVQITGEELVVQNVSREYDIDLLRSADVLLGPELGTVVDQVPVLDLNGQLQFDTEGNLITEPVSRVAYVGGTLCRNLWIDERAITMYTVYIRPRVSG
jgi:hypothetical protein